MDPSNLFFQIAIDEEKSINSMVRCRKCCTFVEIHNAIVDDEIIGYPFDFIHDNGCSLNLKQENKRIVESTLVGIKRKLDTLDVETSQSNVVEEL